MLHFYYLGYWLFHCHIEFHAEIGMSLIFKVGEHDEMPPVPPDFPVCNDWKPVPYGDDLESSMISTTTEVQLDRKAVMSTIEKIIRLLPHLFDELYATSSTTSPTTIKLFPFAVCILISVFHVY